MINKSINILVDDYQKTQAFYSFSKLKKIFWNTLEIHTKMAYNKYHKFINYNEIYLLTEISFIHIIKSYDFNNPKGASFKTYLNNYLKFRLNEQIKKMIPPKKDAMHNYFNLDKIKSISYQSNLELNDFDLQDYINDIKLSKLEKQVFTMHFQGEKIVKISKLLNISYKTVDNALQRAKRKLRKSVIFKNRTS